MVVVNKANHFVLVGDEHIAEYSDSLHSLAIGELQVLTLDVLGVNKAGVHHWIWQVVVRSDVVSSPH